MSMHATIDRKKEIAEKLYGGKITNLKQLAQYANTKEKQNLCVSIAIDIAFSLKFNISNAIQTIQKLFPPLNDREQA